MIKYLSYIFLYLAISANASLRSGSLDNSEWKWASISKIPFRSDFCLSQRTLWAKPAYVLVDPNKNVSIETSTGSVMDGYSFTASFDNLDHIIKWNRTNIDSQHGPLCLIGNWGNTTGSLGGHSFNKNRTDNDVQ